MSGHYPVREKLAGFMVDTVGYLFTVSDYFASVFYKIVQYRITRSVPIRLIDFRTNHVQ